MKLLICIATFRRPKLLANLFEGLSALRFEQVQEPDISLVIVDNDSTGSASHVCASMTRWPVLYCIEKRRGIAQARNRALEEVRDHDSVIFIDDDETPEPDWLEALLVAQQEYGADVVTGPVIPAFTTDVPEWIRHSDFFDSYQHQTGQQVDHCATNNTLVACRVMQNVRQFDDRFGLSGADDLHFFRRTYLAGYKMVWTRNARVKEEIALDRANVSWLLRRAFRAGNCYAIVESSLDSRLFTRAKRFVKGCGRMLQGALEMLPAMYRGQVQAVRSLRRMLLGLGMLAGLFGHTYQPYRVTTGK